MKDVQDLSGLGGWGLAVFIIVTGVSFGWKYLPQALAALTANTTALGEVRATLVEVRAALAGMRDKIEEQAERTREHVTSEAAETREAVKDAADALLTKIKLERATSTSGSLVAVRPPMGSRPGE